jgi:murein tripeptide amidase MpaA
MNKLIVFACLLALAAAAKVDYTGHMLIRVVPTNEFQLRYLLALQEEGFDLWSFPTMNRPVDIRINPESFIHLTRSLAALDMTHEIRLKDIGALIKEEEKDIMLRRALFSASEKAAFDLENYHTYEEIQAFLKDLSSSNDLVSSSVIGTTFQGRGISMATVSTSKTNSTKPVIYFDCAFHAREWIAPATCLWIINELATKYGSDSEVTKLVDSFDWLITPVSNPDGFAYTWTNDRLWRKNRKTYKGTSCVGADPNRNFDAGFGGPGTSNSPCSDTYHGPSAFSEEESAAMRDVLKANRGRVKSTISVHSFSQLWMCPYGYKNTLPADYDEMYRVMEIGVKALTKTYGTQFQYGNIADTIYPAAGSTADYAYDTEKVLYAYAIELRDTGDYGFELPANQIKPTATETFNGLKAMANAILAA